MLTIDLLKQASKYLLACFVLIILIQPVSAASWESIPQSEQQTFARLLYAKDGSIGIPTSGFLLSYPNRDIQIEFQALYDELKQNPLQTYCRFPERVHWLAKQLPEKKALALKNTIKHFYDHGEDDPELSQNCKDYLEYHIKVPVDSFHYIFAAKNYVSVTSMMGHGFLMAQGKDRQGMDRAHAFSFFADISQSSMATLLYDSFIGGIDGAFAVRPYRNELRRYIEDEEREVWQLALNFDETQRAALKRIFWELRDAQPEYLFQSFNCATLTLRALGMINPEILDSESLFVSPVDIYKALEEANLVSATEIHLTAKTMTTYQDQSNLVYSTVKPSSEVQDSIIGLALTDGNIQLEFAGASHYLHTPQVAAQAQSELVIAGFTADLSEQRITELTLYSFINRPQQQWASQLFIGAKQRDYQQPDKLVAILNASVGKTWRYKNTAYSLLLGVGTQQQYGFNAHVQQFVSVKFSDRFTLTISDEHQFSEGLAQQHSQLKIAQANTALVHGTDFIWYLGMSSVKFDAQTRRNTINIGLDWHF